MLTTEQIVKVGKELNREKSALKLSRELHVSVSTIHQVASRLKKMGVKIPRANNVSKYVEAIKILNGK